MTYHRLHSNVQAGNRYISNVGKVGPTTVIVTEADGPGHSAQVLGLNAIAVKFLPRLRTLVEGGTSDGEEDDEEDEDRPPRGKRGEGTMTARALGGLLVPSSKIKNQENIICREMRYIRGRLRGIGKTSAGEENAEDLIRSTISSNNLI